MMQQLGDLEKVWASDLQQLLLALPSDVLLQLLQHEETRVATENTVVFTIERWQAAQDAGQEQVQQLVQSVRMRHCTPYYAGTVMPRSSTVRQGVEREARPLMRECCTPEGCDVLASACCSVLEKYPAWSAPPRPKSEQQPVLEWRLPLSTLQSAVKQLFTNGGKVHVGYSAPSIVQGQPMQITAEVTDALKKEGIIVSPDTPGLLLALYLRLLELPAGAVRVVRARFSVTLNDGMMGKTALLSEWTQGAMSSERSTWGFWGPTVRTERNWQAVEAVLKRGGPPTKVHGVGSAAPVSQGQAHSCHLHIQVQVELN
jgi:hypothetical protein